MNFKNPPTEAELKKYLAEIARLHPCSKFLYCGKSVLKRKIPVLILGDPRHSALFVGATHGSEWLTALLLLRFFDEVCTAFENGSTFCGIDVGKAVAKRGISVIPVLNPDGTEINISGSSGALEVKFRIERLAKGDYTHWNANAAGVDLNHNFGAGWEKLQILEHRAGIYGPAPRQYGGAKPFSEPETRAVCGFCSTFDVTRLWSFHSQGEEIYWYYGKNTPLMSRNIAEKISALSGYKMLEPSGLASHGGLKDWYIQNFCRPGFTIEIGKGENPLPIDDLDGIYEKLKSALAEMMII